MARGWAHLDATTKTAKPPGSGAPVSDPARWNLDWPRRVGNRRSSGNVKRRARGSVHALECLPDSVQFSKSAKLLLLVSHFSERQTKTNSHFVREWPILEIRPILLSMEMLAANEKWKAFLSVFCLA